jgi:hypothetical protein
MRRPARSNRDFDRAGCAVMSDPKIEAQILAKLANATQLNASATLTAAMISRGAPAGSIGELMKLFNDIHFSMFPEPGSGIYEAWKKTFDPNLVPR